MGKSSQEIISSSSVKKEVSEEGQKNQDSAEAPSEDESGKKTTQTLEPQLTEE